MNRLQFFALMLAPLLRPWRAFIPKPLTAADLIRTAPAAYGVNSLTLADIERMRKEMGRYKGLIGKVSNE